MTAANFWWGDICDPVTASRASSSSAIVSPVETRTMRTLGGWHWRNSSWMKEESRVPALSPATVAYDATFCEGLRSPSSSVANSPQSSLPLCTAYICTATVFNFLTSETNWGWLMLGPYSLMYNDLNVTAAAECWCRYPVVNYGCEWSASHKVFCILASFSAIASNLSNYQSSFPNITIDVVAVNRGVHLVVVDPTGSAQTIVILTPLGQCKGS